MIIESKCFILLKPKNMDKSVHLHLTYCVVFPSSRPAGMAVISLAFGRYILEPIFMPCGVPEFAIKLATAIGLSKPGFYDLLL